MQEFFDYRAIKISKEEKQELESKMADAYRHLDNAASELYGFANIRKLRDNYKKQNSKSRNILWCHPKARVAMDWLIKNEATILSAYIKMGHKMALSLSVSEERDSYADYMQEAAMAIYDAMYLYDGSTKFSTYCFCMIKNRQLNRRRKTLKINGITETVNMLKAKVIKGISEGLLPTQALSRVEEEIQITPEIRERLLTSLGIKSDKPILEIQAPQIDHERNNELAEMRRAVQETVLSDMERKLMNAHLSGDETYRKNLSETVINPQTGRYWTKQRLSQIFLAACQKVRETYESRSFKQAS